MSARTLRGKVAIVGVGETPYYRYGKSPDFEFKLALNGKPVAFSGTVKGRTIEGTVDAGGTRSPWSATLAK